MGATRSATCVLAPTVMPIARSILSLRANRTAFKQLGRITDRCQQENSREQRREPHLLGGWINRAGEDLTHERQRNRDQCQNHNRFGAAPVDLRLVVLSRRLPRLFFLRRHGRLAHNRLVRNQRENQTGQVHQEQDDRDLARDVPRQDCPHPWA